MKKFVINLKRRPDRLDRFMKQCPYNDVEVVYAFDGKNPELESKKERKLLPKFPSDRQPGAMGCSISHLRIWKKMVNENIPMAMIFEDDCNFEPNFKEFIDSLVLPSNFKIVFPGGRFVRNFKPPPNAMIPVNEHIYQHNYNAWDNRAHERTLHCYILSFELAKFLISLFDIQTYPKPADHFIIHNLKELNIPVHSTYPLVIWSPIIGDSDIR